MTDSEAAREPVLPMASANDVGSLALLHAAFLNDYELLRTRLATYTGSPEQAADILHDVYLKLRSNPQITEVREPRAYLYRMALNLAKNQRRNGRRFVSADEEALAVIPDDAPDPERAALAADEMRRAIAHLHQVPARQRDIFLARWRDEKSQIEIALKFGIHKRTVQKELERAERYLCKKLGLPKLR